MNKQFLSLLLLASFVGTSCGAAVPVAAVASSGLWGSGANATFTFLRSLLPSSVPYLHMSIPTKLTAGIAGLTGAGFAATADKSATAEFLKDLRLKTFGMTFAEKAAAARPWYKKAFEASQAGILSAYASTKAAALKNPKVAIGLGIATAAGLSYLAYTNYFKSISLSEQDSKSFATYRQEADKLARTSGNKMWSPESEVVVEAVFTTEGTKLPKKLVALLNQHVAYGRKVHEIQYLFDHQNGRSSYNYQQNLAIQNTYKQLDAQVVEQLNKIVVIEQGK